MLFGSRRWVKSERRLYTNTNNISPWRPFRVGVSVSHAPLPANAPAHAIRDEVFRGGAEAAEATANHIIPRSYQMELRVLELRRPSSRPPASTFVNNIDFSKSDNLLCFVLTSHPTSPFHTVRIIAAATNVATLHVYECL